MPVEKKNKKRLKFRSSQFKMENRGVGARGPSRSSSGNYILLPSAAARHYRWKNNQRHYRRQCRRRQPETLATMYFSFKPFDTHTLVTDTVCDTLVAKTQLASDNIKWNFSTQWQNVTTSSCRGRKSGKMEKCTAARQDLVAKVQPCHHIQTKKHSDRL